MTIPQIRGQSGTGGHPGRIRKKFENSAQLYLIIALPLIWLIIFRYYPMYGAQIAFKYFSPTKGIWGSRFVGFRYFERFFTSYQFSRVLFNTLGVSLYQLAAGFPIPIILALALNSTRRPKYRKIVQFITYMPHFISTVVMVGIIMQFLHPRVGLINMAVAAFGGTTKDYMASPALFKTIYVFSGVWQDAGWGTIIYLATLAGIDPQLHEAAYIDGAGRFQRILNVDIPGLMPTAIILLIIRTGHIMDIGFEKVFLMQNSLNISSSEVISTYVYKVGLASESADFSYASAIGLFRAFTNLVLILAVNQLAKKVGETSLW